ncbi:hypothetical protein [Kineosporia babensis]|uniref:Uncharacterized protein n=1 Tax=Kineosporia babensis TaxID=499548 RepID=A0A9X1SSY7_9ACTN|nr:hypothetical protein [Kineosporia babensis]MCD5311124.1 hypothetical protein [Kineosporia babensis]
MIPRPDSAQHAPHAPSKVGPAELSNVARQLRQDDEWKQALFGLELRLLPNNQAAIREALPYLAEVALDPAAPSRVRVLGLLRDCGRVLGQVPAEVARTLLPLANDPDRDVRGAFWTCTWFWPGPVVSQTLLEAFANEMDGNVRLPLIEAAVHQKLVSPGTLQQLAEEPGYEDEVFAAAWTALAIGVHIPTAFEHLVRLWPTFAPIYPVPGESSLSLLVAQAGARAVPLLRAFTTTSERPVSTADLVQAWGQVAHASRLSTLETMDALAGLAHEGAVAELATVLWQVVPVAGERGPQLAEAALRWLDPAPQDHRVTELLVRCLFALQDHRWASVAQDLAQTGSPVTLSLVGQWALMLVRTPEVRKPLLGGTPGRPALPRPVAWAHDDLIAVARSAIAVQPSTAPVWADVLVLLEPSDEVVEVLLEALRAAPSTETTRALAALAAGDPSVFNSAARTTIAEHPALEAEAGAWLLSAQALLSGDDVFGSVWALGAATDSAADLLDLWAGRPSPAYRQACRTQLAGEVGSSYVQDLAHLAAASALIQAGESAAAWPTMRALVDAAGYLMPEAGVQAGRIVSLNPDLRPEWLAQARDIAQNGRPTSSGRQDPAAPATAVGYLLDAADLTAEKAAHQELALLQDAVAAGKAALVLPVAAEVLGRAISAQPNLREEVAEALEPYLSGDTRLLATAEPHSWVAIAWDAHLTALLRAALE